MPTDPDQSKKSGWLRRLGHTPPGDLFRGKITGRLDFERQFEDELGQPLAKHVGRIIQMMGLYPGEQIQAAEELAEQCRRELAGGVSVEQLIERLRVKPTRKAIRKRYVRQRGWWGRNLQYLVLIILAMPVLWIASNTIYYYNSHPTLKVDYVALLNVRAAAVLEADRAWPLYREALLEMNLLHVELPLGVGLSPTHPGWPEVQAYIDEHEASVNQLREAGGMSGMGLTVGFKGHYRGDDAHLFEKPEGYGRFDVLADGTLVESKQVLISDILLPHLGPLRVVGRLLVADAYRAFERDDMDRFCEDIAAICGMADHMTEIKFSICGLVGISNRILAYSVINDVLIDDPGRLRIEHLLYLSEVLDKGSDLRLVSLDSERYVGLDLIQRIYSDDGQGGGHLTPDVFPVIGSPDIDGWLFGDGMLQRVAASLYLTGGDSDLPDRAELTRWIESAYRQSEDALATPMWQRIESESANEWDDVSQFSDLIQGLMYVMLPSNSPVRSAVDRSDGVRVALMAGIALERYRRDHGDWPVSLKALVPEYLTEIPIDPITGGPAIYKIVDDRPKIYSVGVDRDDDGGSIPINSFSGELDNQTVAQWSQNDDQLIDGDWVLYPARPTLREIGPTTKLPEEGDLYYGFPKDGESLLDYADRINALGGYGEPPEAEPDTPAP